MLPKMKENRKVVQKLSREQKSVVGGGGASLRSRTGTKSYSHTRYTGVAYK